MNKEYDSTLTENQVINTFRMLMNKTNDHFVLKDGRNTDDIICYTDTHLKHLHAVNGGGGGNVKGESIQHSQKDSALFSAFCIGEGKKRTKICTI